ncbi:hypothetical protein, partial [Pectobacterium parmentieri]|uniref:hypothetical protein n=1 Tax=Pectobacterium parmentieri TaxID=1905730 RepID=UPI001E5598AF
SLLSSAWGQVGPPRYRRQANSVSFQPLCFTFLVPHNHQNQSLNKLNIKIYESFITHKTPSVL